MGSSLRFVVGAAVTCVQCGSTFDDQTTLSTALNHQIAKGTNGTFTGGKGVLVRTPDQFDNSTYHVVPASFWVNDIIAQSQMYPSGNPWCPNDGSDGYFNLTGMKCDGRKETAKSGPWNYATVGVVVGSAMAQLMPEFDKIQESSWGYGVFYANNANSVDQRCLWAEHYNGWDCPGGWLTFDGKFEVDSSKKGAGNFDFGNQKAGLGGGGAGCHFDSGLNGMDQADALDAAKRNLVRDESCECNYAFNGDWNEWVQNWLDHNQQKPGFESRAWFGKGKSPSWGAGVAMCWMNNPRDMIELQNSLYLRRREWNNQLAPKSNFDSSDAALNRRYWGWNDVPVSRLAISNSSNWDAVIVKLPANLCGKNHGTSDNPSCLDADAQQELEKDLLSLVANSSVKLGSQHVSQQLGSNVLFVREMESGTDQWERNFFCYNWTSPGKRFRIVHTSVNSSACYLEALNATDTMMFTV